MKSTQRQQSIERWLGQNPTRKKPLPEFQSDWLLEPPRNSLPAAQILEKPPANRPRVLIGLATAATIAIVAGALFYLGGLGPDISSPAATKPAAIVMAIKGQARVQNIDSNSSELQNGQNLSPGDTILTGSNTIVDLSLPAGVLVRVAANSEYLLQNSSSQNQIQTNLHKGKVYSLIQRLESQDSFEIKTPTAIAGVRGTRFSISTDGKKTRVHVVMGKVAVKKLDPVSQSEAKTEYILDQYDKNWFETGSDTKIIYEQRIQADFSDAQELDQLARTVQDQVRQNTNMIDSETQKRIQMARQERHLAYNTIVLRNGRKMRGLIVSQTGSRTYVETEKESLVIQASDVLEIKYSD